jgi:hypothetical protein
MIAFISHELKNSFPMYIIIFVLIEVTCSHASLNENLIFGFFFNLILCHFDIRKYLVYYFIKHPVHCTKFPEIQNNKKLDTFYMSKQIFQVILLQI